MRHFHNIILNLFWIYRICQNKEIVNVNKNVFVELRDVEK